MTVLTRSKGALLRAIALLVAGVAVAVVAATARAQPPEGGWRVGQPMDLPVEVSPTALEAANGKGIGLLTAAGVQAAKFETSRALNQYDNATEDTTLALDPRGRVIATLSINVDRGSIHSLVRFDDLGAARGGDEAAMPSKANAILASVAMKAPVESPFVSWDDGMGAWSVAWRRVIGGVPVPADGLTVWVTPQGKLRAIGNKATEVSQGARSIDEAGASDRVRAFMNGNSIARQAKLGSPILEWRQPNDFVTPSLPDSPASTLRLIYAVPYSIDLKTGAHSEGVLWVDVESGNLVGGSDVG